MSPKDKLYCGKDLRKYLYLVGIVAVFILIGSYWYTQYYLKGVGLNATVTGEGPLLAGGVGLPQSQPQSQPQAVPVALWGAATAPSPAPQMQTVAAVSAVPKGGFSRITRRLMTSVVNVSATRAPGAPGTAPQAGTAATPPVQAGPPDNALRFAQPFSGAAFESVGSGIVVTADGYILTNHHVVEQSQEVYVTVFEKDGTTMRYHAEVVSLNAKRELALLKVEPMRPLKPAPLGNSKTAQIGDPVIAIGSPFGLDQTVSQGIVSGKRNAVTIEGVVHKNLLQTDAAINRGNSGGPLVDGQGMVIGINTAIYTPTGAFSGIGFAVPIERAREFVEEVVPLPPTTLPVAAGGMTPPAAPPIYANAVMPHEERGPCASCHVILAPGSAGGGMTPVAVQTPTAPPIYANAVIPHEDRGPCTACHTILPVSPAPTGVGPGPGAGVGQGNAANGAVAAFRPGYQGRGGMNYSFSPGGAVGIPAAVQAPVAGSAGLDGVALDATLAQQYRSPYPDGVWVRSVMPGSLGMQAGVQPNDIVFKINGRWVKSPQEMQGMLAGIVPGQSVRFSVIRAGERQSLSVTVGGVEGTAGMQPVAMVVPQTANDPMMTQPMPAAGGEQRAAPQPAAAPVKTEFEWMGLELTPISPAMKQKDATLLNKFGAVVADLDPGTPGELAGIQVGDIVVAINNQPVPSAGALDQAINATAQQQTILLEVERNNVRMFATLQ